MLVRAGLYGYVMWGAKAYWQMVFDARYMEGRVNPVLRNSAFFNHRKALFCGVFSMGKEKIGASRNKLEAADWMIAFSS